MLKRVLIGALLGGIVASAVGLFVLWRLDDRGHAALAEMCAADGGPSVTRTATAAGLLIDALEGDQCTLCEELVARRHFAYVDYEAKRRGPYLDAPGYYRVSLGAMGDPRCEHHLLAKTRGPYRSIPSDFGADATQCFALERLESRPEGYVFSAAFRRAAAPNGYVLGVVENIVRQEPSGEVLAINRDYLYASVVSTFAAGGGVTDATCPTAVPWRFDRLSMITTVLSAEDQQ